MGRFITSGQITSMLPVFIATGAITPGEIEFFIELAEEELESRIAGQYDTRPFSGTANAPPMVQALCKRMATTAILLSKANLDDPKTMSEISAATKVADDLIDKLITGEAELVDQNRLLIQRRQQLADQVWTSTADYKPTMDVRPAVEQRVSRTRLDDQRQADLDDEGR